LNAVRVRFFCIIGRVTAIVGIRVGVIRIVGVRGGIVKIKGLRG
jgi:hypothetical protein